MVVQTLGEVPSELAIAPERDARLQEQAGRIGAGAVARLLDLLAAAMEATKNGSDARTQLELALVKAASPSVDPSAKALAQRIERLEAALAGALSPERAAPPPAVAARAESPAPPSEPAPGPESPAPPPGPGPEAPVPPSVPAPAAPGPAAAVTEPHVPASNGTAQPVPGALELAGLRAAWPAVIDAVRAENALCAALLEDAIPVAVDGTQVTVAFPPSADFLRRKANDDGYRQCVATAVRTITGAKAQIAYVLAEAPPVDEPLIEAPPTDDEWVARFQSEFDAEEIILDPDPPSESEAR